MKIAILHYSAPPVIGGVESVLAHHAKLMVSAGHEVQVIAGIGKNYEPENLAGKEIIVVANLEPRQLMGFESQGMLLAADGENGPVILTPEQEVLPGTEIK